MINATGGGGGGLLTVLDTATVDHTLTGTGAVGDPYVLSSAARISPVAGNVLTSDANGLVVACEAVQDCVGQGFTQGLFYDDAANQFRARIDPAAGNTITQSAAGLLVAAGGQLTVLDTPTVDHTLTGAGTTVSPYVLSSAARISTTPNNLVTSDATGLLVTCESIQDCVGGAFTQGLFYDDAANAMRARLSTDGGNTVVFGSDGGLYSAGGGGGSTTIVVQDTPCIDLQGNGSALTPLQAVPIISPTAGNALTCTANGLYAAAGAGGGLLTVTDTATVDHTLTGTGAVGDPYVLSSAAKISPVAGNILTSDANGLVVACEAVQDCVGQGFEQGLFYDDAANAFRARIDPAAGNQLTQSAAGLLVPAGGGTLVQVADTATLDSSITGSGAVGDPYVISGAVKISTTPNNLVTSDATGLLITCESVQDCVGQGFAQGLIYDDAANQFRARIDPAAGNQLTQSAAGLFVPAAAGGALVTADSTCIDLSGAGTAVSPLSAAPIVDPAATNLLTCAATGLSAAVLTGCGISGTGTAGSPLTAHTSNTWPMNDRGGVAFANTDVSILNATYCASDGSIRTRPESTSILDRIQGSESPGVTLTTGQTRDFLVTQVVTNLSVARQMHVLGVVRLDWDLSIQPGTQWRVHGTVATEELPAGGMNILYRGRWEDPVQRWQFAGFQLGRTLGVPAGGAVTYNVRMRAECVSGSLTVNQQQMEGRYHGVTV